MPKEGKIIWIGESQGYAMRNGWDIFYGDLDDNGKERFNLQALDDPDGVAADFGYEIENRFDGENRDYDVAAWVQSQADAGNEHCRKAIEFLIERESDDVRVFNLRKTW